MNNTKGNNQMTNTTQNAQNLVRNYVINNLNELVEYLANSSHEQTNEICWVYDWDTAIDELNFNECDYAIIFDEPNNEYHIVDTDGDYILESYDSKLELVQDFYAQGYADHADIEVEALEFWNVGEFLAKKLEEHGEKVTEVFGMYIWSRTCSGQGIYCDYVIETIANNVAVSNPWMLTSR